MVAEMLVVDECAKFFFLISNIKSLLKLPQLLYARSVNWCLFFVECVSNGFEAFGMVGMVE